MRVLFVHGTSVRDKWFNVTFDAVSKQITDRGLGRPVPCYWGEAAASPDITCFKSVPRFEERGGGRDVNESDAETAVWEMLYRDPYAELRILAALVSESGQFPSNEVRRRIEENLNTFAPIRELQQLIMQSGISPVIKGARDELVKQELYEQALHNAGDQPNATRMIMARCLIALSVLALQTDDQIPAIVGDRELRTKLIHSLADEIHPAAAGILQIGLDQLKHLGLRMATRYADVRFGNLIDAQYRFIADILRYQARGGEIRAIIQRTVKYKDEPCILLGHSLGGIAVVDYVVNCCGNRSEELRYISGVITVGSQSSFFHEAGALYSLHWGESLPQTFPKWLNIFDRSDFLSFVARPVFMGDVIDVETDCRQPFPQSHGAYWANPETWKYVADFVNSLEHS